MAVIVTVIVMIQTLYYSDNNVWMEWVMSSLMAILICCFKMLLWGRKYVLWNHVYNKSSDKNCCILSPMYLVHCFTLSLLFFLIIMTSSLIYICCCVNEKKVFILFFKKTCVQFHCKKHFSLSKSYVMFSFPAIWTLRK